MKKLILLFSALALVVGCSSKKKVEDQQSVPTGAVESTPMTFDPAGSDSGKIDGLVTIFFDYDKSTLSAEAKQGLATNAAWLKSNNNVMIQIEGHCDNRGTIEYNLALGERRAQAVKNTIAVGL